ncbi:DUF6300 family protein [Streptomyces sp. NPDC091412]|uniref:DUF6300 family protein n=1 Tax=Streptomyces sp. NPDC091412 TaxID=3366002 RepID=UPI0038137FE9
MSDERPCHSHADRQADRPCSRCGGDLLLHWHGPLMTSVWMELSPACDADRPAVSAFIRWHRDPARDLDARRGACWCTGRRLAWRVADWLRGRVGGLCGGPGCVSWGCVVCAEWGRARCRYR